MLRYLISLIVLPLIQRGLMSVLSAFMRNMQDRSSSSQTKGGRQTNEQSYDRDKDIIYGRVRHIVDGDSLYITRHEDQIRLWGVDAPERHEPGFNKATQMLLRLAMDQDVTVEIVGHDKYGRTLGRVFRDDGSEINREIIRSGTVKEYMRFTKGFYSS